MKTVLSYVNIQIRNIYTYLNEKIKELTEKYFTNIHSN